MSTEPLEGGCLCRAIRYRVTGEAITSSLCHCRSCRLAAGAPAVAWIVFRCADFAFTTGEPVRFRSSSSVVRGFCGACGTPLSYRHDDNPELIELTTATLDAPDRFPPTREIWPADKLAWMTPDPGRRHYPRDSDAGPQDAG